MNKNQALLLLQNFQTRFIRPLSIHLEPNACLGLYGSSGSGKSLLLRAIADLDVNSGEIFLDDKPRNRFSGPQWRRKVALLPAESHWWGDVVREHSQEWPEDLLQQMGFSADVLAWQTNRLSTGEKQRLALVRMLASQPTILLLDEPTANLDKKNSSNVERLIQDYLQLYRSAAIWVSHAPEQLQQVATRRAYMSDGHFVPEES